MNNVANIQAKIARPLLVKPEYTAMFLGTFIAFATFYGVVPYVDIALFSLALVLFRRPPWWALALAVPIGLSAIWAHSQVYPAWTAIRILSLAIVLPQFKPQARWLFGGFLLGISIQSIGLLMVLSHSRPAGLTSNASVLGQVGLSMLAGVPVLASGLPIVLAAGMWSAALTIGIAGARTVLLATWVFAAFNRRPAALVTVAAATVIFVTVPGGMNRLGIATIRGAVEDRIRVNTLQVEHGLTIGGDARVADVATVAPDPTVGTDVATVAPDPTVGTAVVAYDPFLPARDEFLYQAVVDQKRAESNLDPKSAEGSFGAFEVTRDDMYQAGLALPYNPPHFSVFGYGYNSFVAKTNSQGPHMIPIAIAYDMGLLSLPIFGVIAWAIWKRRISWTLVFTIGTLWMFTEEQWNEGAGQYMLALMVVGSIWLAERTKAKQDKAREHNERAIRNLHGAVAHP